MNNSQKAVIVIGVVVLSLMAVYPPWQRVEPGEGAKSMGYGALWQPPREERDATADLFGLKIHMDMEPITANRVDAGRLATQMLVVALVMFGAIMLLKPKSGAMG